jgi:hydroxymethylglutaryl-CoA lyase
MHTPIKIIECPRDAMQGWPTIISTDRKIDYINQLLTVGFDTIDVGSFVSPKAIPQMADTTEVLRRINWQASSSSLLTIVANVRGAEEASAFEQVQYLGYPFSVSETFQQRNTNAGIEDSFERLRTIHAISESANKTMVVYLSMGFGNPYGDPYDESVVLTWADRIASLGIQIISIADTVGLATASQVGRVTNHLIKSLPGIEIGVHLHSAPANRTEKINAALDAGCKRFDGAIRGIGGCPMAGDALVGNMDTGWMVQAFQQKGIDVALNLEKLNEAEQLAASVFSDLS